MYLEICVHQFVYVSMQSQALYIDIFIEAIYIYVSIFDENIFDINFCTICD